MILQNKTLLSDLQQQVTGIKKRAEQLLGLTEQELNTPPSPGRWSVAQVIAHLAYYNTIYLPRIAAALEQGHKKAAQYKPGWLGNYFTKMMQPLPDGHIPSKMKAPSGAVPPEDLDAHNELERFIAQQDQFIGLLQKAADAHLGSIKITTSISTLLKLKLGDTFRFLIAHQQRHFIQIRNVLQQNGVRTTLITT